MRVWMVGCPEPAQAIWELRQKDDPWAADALQGTLRPPQEKQSSLVVFSDFPKYRSALENVVSKCLLAIPSMR